MLKHRLIFGPLMIALLVGVFYGDHWLYAQGGPAGIGLLVLALAAVAFAGVELTRFWQAKGVPISARTTVAAAAFGLVSLPTAACMRDWAAMQMRMGERGLIDLMGGLAETGAHDALPMHSRVVLLAATCWGLLPVLVLGLLFLAVLFRHAQKTRNPQGGLAVGGAALLAAVYLGVLTGFLLLLRMDYGILATIAVILTVKACDIGAYFTGRALGKHKLIPWLSPGKTREGLAGGMALSALVAVGFQHFGLLPLPCLLSAAAFGLVFGLLGQAGDLLASLFKRDAGVKDSGSVIPGFGGVIDVIDSPIAIAPLAYLVLKLVGDLACNSCAGH